MLSNPLCLAIQVLAILLGESPAVCTVFPGLARDDDVTSSGWPGEAWLSSPVDDRCCIEETTPLLILASTWNQRRVTSVPVIASEPLNPRAVSYHGSGLVSSREGNMLSNPLCLAIQVLAILLGESPAVCTVFPGLARDDDVTSSGWPGEAWLSSPVDDRCCIEETTPLLILASTWNQRRVTSVPVIASEPLNPRAVSYHGKEHVIFAQSTTSSRFVNHVGGNDERRGGSSWLALLPLNIRRPVPHIGLRVLHFVGFR
ncbi:hypothetical protein MRX96_012017 [Rhipicephalus microplus]